MQAPDSNHQGLRVVYLGDALDPIPCGVLDAVRQSFDVVGIVHAGRASLSSSFRPNHFENVSRKIGTEYMVLRRDNQRELEAFLERLQSDVMCVVRCEYLLRPFVFNRPRLGTVNVHPSLLPKYRGGDPFYWQYREMDSAGGVTVHCMDEGMDTGDILKQEKIDIELGTSIEELIPEYRSVASRLMVQALNELARGTAQPQPQRHLECPVPARHLRPGEPMIDWHGWPIERVWHVMRGLPERCLSASTMYRWRVGGFERRPGTGEPGTIQSDDGGYYLAHRDGRIRLERCYSVKHAGMSLLMNAYRVTRASGKHALRLFIR